MADPISNNNMLPPPKTSAGSMLAPAVTSTQKLNTGSATGNPRNKCALKPGHSLMDWIRLGNSGVDLAGTLGRVTPVSSEDLAKHNKRNDAWLAVRGKVYNVTRYMDFHPGGVDELMRGVGIDATKLFNEVHAWVNYEQLLAKCYIGPLRNILPDNEALKALPLKTVQTSNNETGSNSLTETEVEIKPRLDWLQKTSDITIFLYTRNSSNPGLVLHCRMPTNSQNPNLLLRLEIEHKTHQFDIELHKNIIWPPKSVSINSETGRVEIILQKKDAELWSTYGTHRYSKLLSCRSDVKLQYLYSIERYQKINHDSFEICLKGVKNVIMLPPVGYHVDLETFINGAYAARNYTPVPSKYLTQSTSEDVSNNSYTLNFLIKSYGDAGFLSTHLEKLAVGSQLQVSAAKGSLKLKELLPHRNFALLAAGSGITPFLSLMEHLLKRNTNRIESLLLMYFNKTESDIWCREFLEQLQTTDERFRVMHILSQGDPTWPGLRGHINGNLLATLTDRKSPDYATFVSVCGPSAFNQAAKAILDDLKLKSENIHIFQG